MIFSRRHNPSVNLALQGGGAHGAFTWGVLDYLLEDGRVGFEGVSGTSAGAMNAVALAHGLLGGSREKARETLSNFWTAVATSIPFDAAVPTTDGEGFALAPSVKLMLPWTHYFSPTQFNPLDINPLRDLVSSHFDFERLRAESPLKLFIAATHANSGKLRLFRSPELTAEALLASACLPTLHHPVEIDGEPYWDGGYAANPAVFPLFHECHSADILLVLLSPLRHKTTPRTASEIKNRIQELAFNSNFLREMRMFAHLRASVSQSWPSFGRFERRIARTNFHVVDAEDLMSELPSDTKLAVSLRFFETLKDKGRERARAWLQTHHAHLGKRSSVMLSELFD